MPTPIAQTRQKSDEDEPRLGRRRPTSGPQMRRHSQTSPEVPPRHRFCSPRGQQDARIAWRCRPLRTATTLADISLGTQTLGIMIRKSNEEIQSTERVSQVDTQDRVSNIVYTEYTTVACTTNNTVFSQAQITYVLVAQGASRLQLHLCAHENRSVIWSAMSSLCWSLPHLVTSSSPQHEALPARFSPRRHCTPSTSSRTNRSRTSVSRVAETRATPLPHIARVHERSELSNVIDRGEIASTMLR